MKLSVIVPVHNGSDELRRCLEAIAASTRTPDEILVVDDSSTDDSVEIAQRLGARVLPLPGGPYGPAVARNRGVEAASGDVVIFFDADVLVHTDTVERIEKYFAEQPDLTALFGSYDASPPARGTVTLYKNLLHHYVHQHGRREAWTFWTGCGAVRREAFLAVGGFDAGYERPSIEDIELGQRLRAAGHRIWLCPDVQVSHLKRWTLKSMVRTDIFCRAVPWTRLLLRQGSKVPNDLNLDFKSRLSAVMAWLAVILFVVGFWKHWAWLGAIAALSTVAFCNADLLRFFQRQGGTGFALGALGLHNLYFLYSSLIFGVLTAGHKLARRALILLLAATLFKGLAWSIIIPAWQASDEPQQFLYAQSVERSRSLRVEPQFNVPQEVAWLADAVQFNRIVHQNENSINFDDPTLMGRQIAAADSRDARHTRVPNRHGNLLTQPAFTFYHPPLYYGLTGAAQAPLENSSIRWRLLVSRWVSVALSLIMVVLAFYIGCALWPGRSELALLLAALVSFQPMVTFTFSTVTNISLEIVLFSACLLIALRVARDGLDLSRAIALGLVTALGLLAKVSFLCLLPLLGLLLIQRALSYRKERSTSLARQIGLWAVVAVLPLVLSGWWYRQALTDLSRPMAGTVHGFTLETASGLLSRQNPIGKYARVLISYWGNFGWPDTIMPLGLLAVLGLLSVVSVVMTTVWLFKHRHSERGTRGETVFALSFLGCATLSIILFYIYMDRRFAGFGIRGQYYFPAIAGQMAWFLWGLSRPLPQRLRPFGMWLLGLGMVALNIHALFAMILPRYYGSGNLSLLLQRVTLLQPVNFILLGIICTMFAVSCLAVLTALGGVLWAEDHQIETRKIVPTTV